MNEVLICVLPVLVLWEVACALFAGRIYRICREYSRQRDSLAKWFFRKAHPGIVCMGVMDAVGLAVCFAGLFSDGCAMFFLVLALSLSTLKKFGVWAFRLDALLTIGLYVAAWVLLAK